MLFALLALIVILLAGRGSAQVARRFKQAEVLGELLGGFLIGPSVFGALFPSAFHALFQQAAVGAALSMLSWIGAILMLLIAGLEVDLQIVRQLAKPGGYTAAGAILTSLLAGTLFSSQVMGRPIFNSFFLGIVLSVTGVSVIAKILIERDSLRRGYAQVILAAGITSEVLVWPLISLVSSLHKRNGAAAGALAVLFLVLFFLVMFTLGRRFTFWAMRRVADLTSLVSGQLSLVIVLAFAAAAITEGLGLHALLGAFTFGVLLSQAPRTTTLLKENIQVLAVGFFAPVFFVLAGMRVDIFRLSSAASIGVLLLLFVVATLVKVTGGALSARIGKLSVPESLLVGIGVNLKGGSDVIVAILGVELGLLSTETYTMYTIIAILTVFVSQPMVALLEKRVSPSQEEMARLNREEARRRAYLSAVERVLVPMNPELFPAISANVVQALAAAKQKEEEIFDITQLNAYETEKHPRPVQGALVEAEKRLDEASELDKIELTIGQAAKPNTLESILEAGKKHNLIAIAAKAPRQAALLSFGKLQDRIIDESESDVLVAVRDPKDYAPVKRILVPVNGHEHSLSAADLAGYLAKEYRAELVLLTVVQAKLDSLFWKERKHRDLLEAGYRLLREVSFRVDRLGIKASHRVQLGEDVTEVIKKELRRVTYGLVVLGTLDRSTSEGLHLGGSIHPIVATVDIPALVLVSHA